MKKYKQDAASELEEKSKLLEIEIDRRKLAENALRINKERYGEAQAVGLAGNWEYNLQTNHFWGSEEAKRIYGFNPEDDDFSVDEVENCILERERVHQALVDLIEVNKLYNLEFEIHPRNSLTPRIISSIAELKRDEHGSSLLVTGVIRDITERRQEEEKFRHLAAIVESSNDAIIGKTLDGTVISWNKGAERAYGYSADEMKGKSILCIVPLDRRDEIEWILEKVGRGEEIIPYETERINKDGTKIWVSLTVSPVKNTAGDITGASTIARDITDRKKAESALRAANAYNRSLIEASLDPLVTIGDDGKITDANAATEKATGYLRGELIKTDFSDYFADSLKAQAGYIQVFTEGFVLDYPLILRHRDGHLMDVLYNASVYRDESGNVVGVFAAARDITERKKSVDSILASLRLTQFAQTHSLDELLQATIDEVEKMTGSQVGFLHFLAADQKTLSMQMWSTRTLQEMCRAEGKGRHYDIEQAGVWVDCVRERRPVIHNDYSALPHKKGLPPSHARVIRELVVPVFRGDRIVTILGVGNKGSDYNESDIRTASFFADLAWDIAERKQAEMALQQSEEKYRSIFENSTEGIYQSTPEGRFISVNPALAHMYGYDSPEEMMAAIVDIGSQLYVYAEERIRYKNILEKFGTVLNFETQSPKKNGEVMWVSLNAREKRNADGDIKCYDGFVKDITSRKMAEIDLEKTAEKLRKSLMNTIQALSVTVEIRDPYTAGHQKRVSKLTRAIAQGMDLPKDTVDNICMASIIHDIGKLSLPAEILSKPGKLADIEFSLIKAHSQSGYDIIKDIGLPYPIAEMVLQHHEKIDGSGYPRGLKNGQILLESKIITVADVVEAMASHRPYRPALGIDAALEEIEKYKGILYDPAVVDMCLELFRERGFTFED